MQNFRVLREEPTSQGVRVWVEIGPDEAQIFKFAQTPTQQQVNTVAALHLQALQEAMSGPAGA